MWGDIVILVLAIGAINGLILSVILWNLMNANGLATKVFGVIVLTFALLIVDELGDYLDIKAEYPHLMGIADGFILITGPLLFLYSKLIIGQKKRLTLKDTLHVIPFLLFSIYMMPFYLQSGDQKLINSNYDDSGIVVLLKTGITLIYLLITLFSIHQSARNRETAKHPVNNFKNIVWFSRLMWFLLGTGLVSIAISLFDISLPEFLLDSDTVAVLLLSTIFYANSFILIRNPFILWGTERFEDSISEFNSEVSLSDQERYKTSPLDEKDLKRNVNILIDLMRKEKPYLDSSLNPQQLERLTGIKTYYISQTLSEVLDKNFYEFVNAFRVEEAKRLILEDKHHHKTILALGLESGFNSKSSFNRAFKNFTGLTPSQFKNQFDR